MRFVQLSLSVVFLDICVSRKVRFLWYVQTRDYAFTEQFNSLSRQIAFCVCVCARAQVNVPYFFFLCSSTFLLSVLLIFHASSLWSSSRPPRPGGTPETPRRTPATPPQPSNPALQAQIKQGNYKRKGGGRLLHTPMGPCGDIWREAGSHNVAYWQ